MNPSNPHSRLSRIDTLWSVVQRAHGDDPDDARVAQQRLLELYGGAIRRYLLAATRNEDLANELFQQFALKFVSGEFQGADPTRGRFRYFVKTVLSRLIALHFRQRNRRRERPLKEDSCTDLESTESADDRTFLASWREELLAQTWQRLADHESQTGVPYNTVLRLRVIHPGFRSQELADTISAAIGKRVAAGAARVMVHRARDKFARLMIDVVADTLADGSLGAVEAELCELGLIDYCREALDTFNGPGDDDGVESRR